MNRYIILLLLYFPLANAQIDTSLIEKGRRIVAIDDSSCQFYLMRRAHKMTIEENLLWYKYDGEINSPLTNAKFLLYDVSHTNPNSRRLVVSYKSELFLKRYCSHEYGCCDLIGFINCALAEQAPLTEKQLEELIECITKLSDPGFLSYKLISSWKDIPWVPEHSGMRDQFITMPDSLKSVIRPLSISSDNGNVEANYFVRNTNSLIKKINLVYRNKQIEIKTQNIGKYGFVLLRY
jgi:hypothetical protein